MTSKQRVYATFAGQPVDRMPVTALYWFLTQQDHFAEFAERPQSELHDWLHSDPADHLRLYRYMMAKTPFDVFQPHSAPPRADRPPAGSRPRQDQPYQPTRSGHASDYAANQTQYVFDKADADEQIVAVPARDIVASGVHDYLQALVAEVGETEFIISGGVIGTLYSCGFHLGQANAYAMLVQQPDLIEYVSGKILEQNVEQIRAYAAAGGDAIYIDDSTATSDVISVPHYERFCLPYLKQMVREIHAVGLKAITLYFGGVADRLEQIAATGADALSVETTMKGYVNDIHHIALTLGDRMTLFGNIDPVGVLQRGTDAELEAEIARQVAAGKNCRRGFIICTGSPVTPATSLARIQQFVRLGHKHGASPR